ncbi:FAD/NAD(P)-binding domain-containing protein [Ramaria rubella]|nr:FAD/NAD(P)-binding domain-containing protein [Ramaria rubella]
MASGPKVVTQGFDATAGGVENSGPLPALRPFAINDLRPMRVVVIGAGFSGIIAGIRIPQRLRNVELVIYERHSGVGGTWRANNYPGLACDLPSHCYQLTFERNPHWSSFYPTGPEILAYLERVAEKYKLMQYMKFNHTLTTSIWDEKAGKWNLTLSTPQGIVHDSADIVLNCTGLLSQWDWPKIDGLFDFKGDLFHSANWNPKKEGEKESWEGKSIAVIGVGSSAIQIVPHVQPKASRLANFVRGKTWIAAPFAASEIQARSPGADNHYFTEEEKREFEDEEYYSNFRRKLEDELNSIHGVTIRGHEKQLMGVKLFKESMIEKLAKKPEIAEHLIPSFPVACRRLTPGPGYLEALVQDNVEFVPDHIKRVTPNGIETVDGKQRDFDIIVCATGYDASYRPRNTVIGRNGADLQEKWSDHPTTYLSVATDGFPNWFYMLGPNSGVGSGSLLVLLERQIEYIIAVIAKLQRERIKSIEVKKEAVDAFEDYMQNYFPTTVYSEKCRTWYKMGAEGGRVVGLWPGSGLHALKTLANPRWEDYTYEYLDNGKKLFYWLGNGWTADERDEKGNRAYYLDEIDYPPVPS